MADVDVLLRDLAIAVRFGDKLMVVVEEIRDLALATRVDNFLDAFAPGVVVVGRFELVTDEQLRGSADAVVFVAVLADDERVAGGVAMPTGDGLLHLVFDFISTRCLGHTTETPCLSTAREM